MAARSNLRAEAAIFRPYIDAMGDGNDSRSNFSSMSTETRALNFRHSEWIYCQTILNMLGALSVWFIFRTIYDEEEKIYTCAVIFHPKCRALMPDSGLQQLANSRLIELPPKLQCLLEMKTLIPYEFGYLNEILSSYLLSVRFREDGTDGHAAMCVLDAVIPKGGARHLCGREHLTWAPVDMPAEDLCRKDLRICAPFLMDGSRIVGGWSDRFYMHHVNRRSSPPHHVL